MSLPPGRGVAVQSRRSRLSQPMIAVVVVADGVNPVGPSVPAQPAMSAITKTSGSVARDLGLIYILLLLSRGSNCHTLTRYCAARDLGLIWMVSSGAAAPVGACRQDAVGDQVAHHLERPAADREHARVAHHALERKTPSVAGGAVELQRLARDLLRGLRGERLRLRGFEWIGEPASRARRRAMDQQAGRVELDRHVSELPAQALELGDR